MNTTESTSSLHDPVCGMAVTADSAAASSQFRGQTYYFCSTHCQQKFDANAASFVDKASTPAPTKGGCGCGSAPSPTEPKEGAAPAAASGCCGGAAKTEEKSCCSSGDKAHPKVKPSSSAKYFCPMCPGVESDKPGDCPKCGMALERNPTWKPSGKTIYTCPMHPEIEQDHPGDCPICGMTLEPKGVVAGGEDEEENAELRDMTRRFWIGAALTLPVFFLAMAHLIPSIGADAWVMSDAHAGSNSRSPCPWSAGRGWPFFQRGWRSVVSRHLNMFTLIAIGVGAAFVFSAVAMLAPGCFHPRCSTWAKSGLF